MEMGVEADLSLILKNYTAAFSSILTGLGLLVAGLWAYQKSILTLEQYPHIEASTQVNFVGQYSDDWIVELVVTAENKGTVMHRMFNMNFVLCGIPTGDNLRFYDGENAPGVGAQISCWAWVGSYRFCQAIRRDTGMPTRSSGMSTKQATGPRSSGWAESGRGGHDR